jgi:hypothetical protein
MRKMCVSTHNENANIAMPPEIKIAPCRPLMIFATNSMSVCPQLLPLALAPVHAALTTVSADT